MPRIVDKLPIQRLVASGSQCYEYKSLQQSGALKKRNVENRCRILAVTATPAICFDGHFSSIFSKKSDQVQGWFGAVAETVADKVILLLVSKENANVDFSNENL